MDASEQARTKGSPFKNPQGNMRNISMKTNKRRDLKPDAGLKPSNMKRTILSTEQSITLTSLSDNDRLSKDNLNDTANSKEADSKEMNQLRSIASELVDINQREKEVIPYELTPENIQTSPSNNLDENVTEKDLVNSRNNSEMPPRESEGFTENTPLPRSQPTWDFTTERVNSNSSKTLNLLNNFNAAFPLQATNFSENQDVRDPASFDDVKYGKVKYSNEAKVISHAIGNLKSRLDKKPSPADRLNEHSLTTVSSDVPTYFVDMHNAFITPDNLYFANDSAVSSNKSANKVFQDIPWPVKKEAVVEGDVIIGGLMMVHEREDSITCGPIMPQGGIQALEAMLYTLDQINLVIKPFLPNITLGAHILDDCDKDTYGLEMAVDFIKGKPLYFIALIRCTIKKNGDIKT